MTRADQATVCEACGGAGLREFEVPGLARMQYCPHCELYQKARMLAETDYGHDYHVSYDRQRARKLRISAARLRLIASLLPPPGRLLDVGCSLGFFVETAARLGWQASGVDVSADAVTACMARGLDCHVTSGDDLPFADDSFDCVTAWHVVEHLPDVAAALRAWRRVIRPGGLLVLETPNATCRRVRREGAGYRRFWKRGHLYVFSPASLIAFARRAGFEVLPLPRPAGPTGAPLSEWVYAWGYDLLEVRLKRLLGLDKAFQLYLRKPA